MSTAESIHFEDEEEPSDEKARIQANVGWRYTVQQIRRDTTARMGLYVIVFLGLIALFTSIDYYIFDYAFAERYLYHPERDPPGAQRLLPPVGLENQFGSGTLSHPLGTDQRGRDILVRLIYGTRIAIMAGLMATLIGFVGGTLIGAISGYYGGWVDDVLQRSMETLYAIPFLVLVIAFMVAFGQSLLIAMIGVGLISIPVFNRLIRSRVVSVREEEYIEAARAGGLRTRTIILHYIIPNSIAPVLVQATLQLGFAILVIAGLSFLGFGVQPPTPDWGQMLAQSRNVMIPNPWFSIWPGLAILITVVAFNTFGDGLQDALDPRIKN